MYIVAIAWLYVVLMMSLTERSAVAGVATFLLYGVAPLALFLWLVGTPARRRRRLQEAQANAQSDVPAVCDEADLTSAGQDRNNTPSDNVPTPSSSVGQPDQ